MHIKRFPGETLEYRAARDRLGADWYPALSYSKKRAGRRQAR